MEVEQKHSQQNQPKPKSRTTKSQAIEQEKPDDSMSSLEIAQELIRNTKGYEKVLKAFKSKKNNNYEAFSKHVFDSLKNAKFNYKDSYALLKLINSHFVPENTGSQAKAIFDGFALYWRSVLKPSYPKIQETLIEDIHQFSQSVIAPMSKFLLAMAQQEDIQDIVIANVMTKVKELIPNSPKNQIKKQAAIRILLFVATLKCYDELQPEFMAVLASTASYHEIAFFIKGILKAGKQQNGGIETMTEESKSEMVDESNLPKQDLDFSTRFIMTYVQKCIDQKTLKDAEAAIKQNKLEQRRFPRLLLEQKKNYLWFLQRTRKVHFIELLLVEYPADRKQHFTLFSEILVSRKKFKEAMFFIEKYGLHNCPAHQDMTEKGIFFEREKLLSMKNCLISMDSFGPTELRVYHSPTDFIQLQDFAISENDVEFIDDSERAHIALQSIFTSVLVGIDCQKSGGRNAFDPVAVCTAQISISGNGPDKPDRIFIFDILKLCHSKPFQQDIKTLFQGFKGSLIGHDIGRDITDLLTQCKVELKPEKWKALKIIDTIQLFKKKCKNHVKFSLEHVATTIFGKHLSKYEQCSGWRNRPLRKAQLHYAALDSYLPIKLREKLEKMN